MAQSAVAITAGSGINIDAWSTASNAYKRQGIVVADPSVDAAAAAVGNAAPGSTDYGLTVRDVTTPTISTNLGATTDAAATGNGSLIGIEKQVRTLLAGGLPATLGQKAMTASLAVVLASDQAAIPVTQSGTWNVRTQDGSGNAITSTASALDINVKSGALANSFSDKQATLASFTITLASLASVAAPPNVAGRQSTLVDNTSNLYIGAVVYLSIKLGTSPTANTLIYVFLVRYDNSAVADDAAGTSDAALTVINATQLGTILNVSTTTGVVVTGIFDTTRVVDSLGPKWGIAIVNCTGVALNGTEGNHTKNYIGIRRQLN